MSFQKASLSYSLFHPLQMKKCSRKFFYADSIQGKRTSSPEIPFKADMVLERTVPQQALQEIRVRGFYEEKMLTQRRREICVSAPLVLPCCLPQSGHKASRGSGSYQDPREQVGKTRHHPKGTAQGSTNGAKEQAKHACRGGGQINAYLWEGMLTKWVKSKVLGCWECSIYWLSGASQT